MQLIIKSTLTHYYSDLLYPDNGRLVIEKVAVQLNNTLTQIRRVIIRKSYLGDYGSIRTYLRYGYSVAGQINYYMTQTYHDKEKGERFEMHLNYDNYKMIGYRDSRGNHWEESWGIDNPFEDQIREIKNLESSVLYRAMTCKTTSMNTCRIMGSPEIN